MAKQNEQFTFEISLSVLNHLGRNLYRSFMTVLGEAISNAWDADAENVWIYIDKEKNSLVVKDDGDGMEANDFQEKFLKIGYSKRKDSSTSKGKKRPFIGRKGIGKLALLSCAKRISVLTRVTVNAEYVGGVIDNSGLTEAIKQDLKPDEYHLGKVDDANFKKYMKGHKRGTIIYFEDINDGIKNSTEYLKKLIALYFRFSLFDKSFSIYVDEEPITLDHLSDFANLTQFAWNINNLEDPYIDKLVNAPEFYKLVTLPTENTIKGFVASVKHPSQLKIRGTDEKATVDLFVNGRLREKDILKHIPSTRVVESYLYGQIHFNEMDDEVDRFASSREGIVADDEKFKALLEKIKKIIARVMKDWDDLRNEIRQDGDPDNEKITKKERKSRELFNVVSEEYSLPKKSENKSKVDRWVDALGDDAQFNFSSYAECFISENLIRAYIEDKKIPLSPQAINVAKEWKDKVVVHKFKGNLSIDIRRLDNDLSYLSMDDLAYLVDKKKPESGPSLARDADEYKPIRDALMHTALLTVAAKAKLTGVFENIKGRLKNLLSDAK